MISSVCLQLINKHPLPQSSTYMDCLEYTTGSISKCPTHLYNALLPQLVPVDFCLPPAFSQQWMEVTPLFCLEFYLRTVRVVYDIGADQRGEKMMHFCYFCYVSVSSIADENQSWR